MKSLDNAFNWDIEKTKVVDNASGLIIPGFNNIKRNDTGSTITIKPETFHPMTTQQFSDTAYAVAEEVGGENLEFTDWETSTKNIGASKPIITCQMKVSEPLEIAGSRIDGVLTLGVGFDGQRSFFIGHTNKYLRCTNEFSSIVKDFSSRLTRNHMVRVEEIIKNIQFYREYEANLYNDFKLFQNVKIDESLIQECVGRIVGLTEEEKLDPEVMSMQKQNKVYDILASVRPECAELGQNAWGLFNGITHYTTHVYESKANKGYNTMFGARNTMNQKAYNFCKELLTA